MRCLRSCRSAVRSSRRPVRRTTAVLLAAFLLATEPALASWKITLEGADVTAIASVMERGPVPVANIAALAPALSMQVRVLGDELFLIDTGGTEWRARGGALQLEANGRSLPLVAPVLLQGTTAYLPLDALAELARLQLNIDRSTRQVDLTVQRHGAPAAAGDWETITIEKTPEEKGELAPGRAAAAGGRKGTSLVNLPPAHDSFRFGVGVGHVPGADWGMEFTGSGKVMGAEVSFGSFLTQGPQGLLGQSSRLAVVDREGGWGTEWGDLSSDVWGFARGARYSWRAGKDRWPSLAIYLKASRSQVPGPVLAYRDEFKLHRGLWVGGELATDGSMFLKGRFQKNRLSLYAYDRLTSGQPRGNMGAFVSYDLWKGVSLYGGVSHSSTGERKDVSRNVGVRIPLRPGIDLTLDQTRITTGVSTNTVNGAMLSLPVGPVRFMTRYQTRNGGVLQTGPAPGWIGVQDREVHASAAYFMNPRVSFDYQVSTRWQQNGQRGSWEQLVSTFRLSDRTQFHVVSAFPEVLEPERLRMRVSHSLGKAVSLTADYGQLTPYQGIGVRPGERGVMLMLRSHLDTPTPARGARITGRVVDQRGQPLQDVTVRLKGYQTLTDRKGRYTFRHVPPGSYEISLDQSSLPADCAADGGARQLTVNGRSRKEVNFVVVPLNTITGRVYWDKDGDGAYQPGEGLPSAVLLLDDFATATGDEGAFGFYNVAPGKHTVRLDTTRLPSDFAPASPVDVSVELLPGRSVSDLIFRLVRREKEVIFQSIP